MTNEELDRARVDEAIRTGNGIVGSVALIAARLAREGWTPPEPVDSDLAEAEALWLEGVTTVELVLAAIKRGRELERDAADIEIDQLQETVMKLTEAKPKVIWVKHNGSVVCPDDVDAWGWLTRTSTGLASPTTPSSPSRRKSR